MNHLTLSHEDVTIRVEWPQGSLSVDQFVRITEHLADIWDEITGSVDDIPASAITYLVEEEHVQD